MNKNPTTQLQDGNIYKESVELASVYLLEGCGKTLTEIRRYNTPHLNRYGDEAQDSTLHIA